MYVTPEEWEQLKSLHMPIDGSIVECVMDEKKQWKFVRFRRDRVHGNHINTVNNIMKCLNSGVSKKELIAVSKEVRKAWKERETSEQTQRQQQAQQNQAIGEGPERGQSSHEREGQRSHEQKRNARAARAVRTEGEDGAGPAERGR